MSFTSPPLFITGGDHPGETLRAFVRDAALRSQGVSAVGDLKVTATSSPSASVQIAAGSATILGVDSPGQGSYYGVAPDVTIVPITPTGGSPRSDMVIARVVDPQYGGIASPDVDTFRPYVATPVGSGQLQPPAGISGIPLARIDMPASSTVVTGAMITDLRALTNPRQSGDTLIVFPSSVDLYTPTPAYINWLDLGTVAVPAWATKCKIRAHLFDLQVNIGDFLGRIRGLIDGASTSPPSTTIDQDYTPGKKNRFNSGVAGWMDIPSAMRGTVQHARIIGERISGAANSRITADSSTTVLFDFDFVEAPV